ncbi:restriction endonuclease subunit S [Vibrio casei]|uniref:Restriction endonuclease subunit S n=1 Tax=Vibrio casei TaxID=673372 RepID=A0A368LMD2_9VIBR|nr:restriction endonuclease subunit S [Vibrio casei]RCS73054.1 restriction endonuclease subunit S [Vibrio casei]SJN33267.1 Type I restriction-modification system, specificity subunit S [Vibrio casei]
MVPNGWELTCLGNIANTTMGYAFKSKDFVKNGIPLIRMGNLYQNKLDLARSPIFLPSEFSAEYERFLLKSGDLVMSMTGTMGKRDYGFTVQIPKGTPDSLLNQRVMKFDTKANSALEYLKYLLRSESFLTRLYAFPGGTKQANLSAKQVSEILVLLPPLPEQRKIAKILSTWDKAISTTEVLIETSKQQKKALMQQLLTGKKRLVNPDTGEKFEGEWKKVELGKLLDYKQPTPYLVKSTEYSNEYLTPVLTAGKTFILGYSNEDFGIFREELPAIIFDDFTTASKFVNFPFKAKSSAMKILIAKDGVSIKYVYEAIQVLNYPVGGHQRHWISIFANLVIGLPEPEEQQKIAQVLTAADKEIEIFESKLAHLKQEKKALMQQLFTGKRRVKVDEEEAA